MPKIKIKILINSDNEKKEIEVNSIIQDEVIKYKEDKTLVIFDYKDNILIRENKEFKMKYQFIEDKITYGTITMKDFNNDIELKINTKKIERNNNNIKILFEIEDNSFLYQIEEIK